MMGTEIFQFGPGKAEKIGFKDVNLNYEVIVIMDFLKKGIYIKVYLLLFGLILNRAGREELQSYSIRLLSHPDLASVKNLALAITSLPLQLIMKYNIK